MSINPPYRMAGETWAQFIRRRKHQTRHIERGICRLTIAEIDELVACAAASGPRTTEDVAWVRKWQRRVRLWKKRYGPKTVALVLLDDLIRLRALDAGDLFRER